MRDLEREERNKENEPARRSLEFGTPTARGNAPVTKPRPSETNVGIGKRARSVEQEEEEMDGFSNLDDYVNPNLTGGKRTRRGETEVSREPSHTSKRFKSGEVLAERRLNEESDFNIIFQMIFSKKKLNIYLENSNYLEVGYYHQVVFKRIF